MIHPRSVYACRRKQHCVVRTVVETVRVGEPNGREPPTGPKLNPETKGSYADEFHSMAIFTTQALLLRL